MYVRPDTTLHRLSSFLLPLKQWAAVTTQRGDTSDPPHVCWPPCCRLTCQGQSSIKASEPPTIRSWDPACPQSEQDNDITDPDLHTLRSIVAWCMGVLVVPGLIAVNGPVFRDNVKASTRTFVLWGWFVYPSCLHAVSVCCVVQSSLHTLRQPEPRLYTWRICRLVVRRTGNVVLTVKLDTQVISSSPPVQSSFPSQAWSMGMNLTERLQKKYLLSISTLRKYPAVTSMPSTTTTVRIVSNTFFQLHFLSFWVFGAVMGFLWRPGRGTAGLGFKGLELSSGTWTVVHMM